MCFVIKFEYVQDVFRELPEIFTTDIFHRWNSKFSNIFLVMSARCCRKLKGYH